MTMRDIINNYLFLNTFGVLAVGGAKLKETIKRSVECSDMRNDEASMSADFLEPKPQRFNYGMYGGISYTIHAGKPKGQRMSNMMIRSRAAGLKRACTACINSYRVVGDGQRDMYINTPAVEDIQIEGV